MTGVHDGGTAADVRVGDGSYARGMAQVNLARWSPDDLALLRAGNTPGMTAHLGGPETDEQVLDRHQRYLRYWETGEARMFRVVADGEAVGAVGWWSTTWRGTDVHETGWFVVPEAQGHGHAASAVRLVIDDAREHARFPVLMAFPSADNLASNALCSSTGFTSRGQDDLVFRSVHLRVTAWGVDL